ncbi:MAG: YbjN domain-containing protein [Caldilineaceae bacterium]
MTIPEFFDRYEWSCEEVESGIWRASFADEREEEYDLFVAQTAEWLHFAVSPLTPRPTMECAISLHEALLHLNQSLRLARFALDDEGDVALLADLPLDDLCFAHFAASLDALTGYTRQLASELTRVATQPGYRSPLF